MGLRLRGGARRQCCESARKAASLTDGGLIPAGNIAHVGKMMCDALVTIDTGLLTSKQKTLVRLDGPRTLSRGIHRLRAVAVAALERVVGLHAGPFVHCKLQPMVQKLVTRIDRAEKLSPDFL